MTYWGLRDYGTARWSGGDSDCDHVVGEIRTSLGLAKLGEKYRGGGVKAIKPKPMMAKGECPKCGAVRVDAQLGLESTLEEYVERLVGVFREVWRVLRDDGTVWLNLGDCYAGSGCGGVSANTTTLGGGLRNQNASKGVKLAPSGRRDRREMPKRYPSGAGLKRKDLVGLPWTVALALRADGWYLREDIIWEKTNAQPENVQDRCSNSHEYLFHLSKAPRYYHDLESFKVPCAPKTHAHHGGGRAQGKEGMQDALGNVASGNFGKWKKPRIGNEMVNRRSVWSVATEASSEEHFAAYPEALVTPCILAGCPEGGVVLDPFVGTGTTVKVAQALNRKGIGCDLDPKSCAIARRRTAQMTLC